MKRTPLIFILVGIVAAIAGALLASNVFQNPSAAPALKVGTVLQPPRPLPDFVFVDHNGQRFDNERLRNRWSLVFFGFVNCADVCPTTLTVLGSTIKALADLPVAQRPQAVFVSVDAKRDTAELLKAYVNNFDPAMIGVTGAQPDLDAFTKALGIPSAIRPLDSGYAVDHSAAIIAINPQGEWRALFSPPHTVDGLASDYRALAGANR
ncbi:MAG: SCO family protein [Candidatus Obscuribacterales bacterium]|nr:SCO family protein [Steroidobacteraceae bacterium]